MKFQKIRNLIKSVVFALVLTVPAVNAQKLNVDLFKNMKARSIGPAGMSGRVTSIDVVHSEPDIIYVGTASGGLWKSESGGISWTPLFDKEKAASIGAVAIDQRNPSVIWAGTGEGNPRNSHTSGYGIYKSLDGGKSWKLMGLEETRTIHRIIIDPHNPDVVYVAAMGSVWGENPERGIYKTTDGGESWKKILFTNNKTGCADLVMDPTNPNKLIAAMWEYQRWPWFFNSGGPGSALYVTFDGGKTWKKRTEHDGLPEGELGRVGLAIAPSQPEIVYALVESKKNALYRSVDGGFKWHKVSTDKNKGDRPFYYADIFVDPKNENRIYSLYSRVSMSEDGGKTFKVILPYYGVHPDHHAWWIHPDDPDYMIDGNDGGLNISRDRGKTWQFISNLPLAQFYHINVDMDIPYNVYGGLQDNGSWRGPSQVWRHGGIRNTYWEELFFGDGFDVLPAPGDLNMAYAMSQGGNLARVDLGSGYTQFIKPIHPEGTELRFNWNAAIAQDPFDENTIYYGSQFVHKSTNRGETWEIISPDLTTDDPEKQKQRESGGLTYDVTNAENHTTIVSIAPGPLKKGVIWAGTDDGNLQLTQDGGKTWSNLISKIKDAPANAWIPQIHVSGHSEGEAFVVINNYRQNDWKPYLYHTNNYGKSWARLADENNVWGYCLSVVQDPVVPNLLFLGTEYGLYVSVDYGKNWAKWENGFPTVSTMDMVIHPRDHDLVIGTFGRSVYILDDIQALRTIANKGTGILNKPLYVFQPADAIIAYYRRAAGTRFSANGMFEGENKPDGAIITWYVKEGAAKKKKEEEDKKDSGEEESTKKDKKEKVIIEIIDSTGKIIRTLKHRPDTGMNRMVWELDQKGVRSPGSDKPKDDEQEPGGIRVLPGTYKARFTWGAHKDSTTVKVKFDPRMDVPAEQMKARQMLALKRQHLVEKTTQAVDQLKDARASIDLVLKQLPDDKQNDAAKQLKKDSKTLKDSIQKLIELVLPKEDVQGIFRDPDILSAKIGQTGRYINSPYDEPNSTQLMAFEQLKKVFEGTMVKINGFFEKYWKAYQEQVNKANISPFKKDLVPVKLDE